MPARPRPARRSSSKPSPSPGFSDGRPNRTTSGRGRPQVRRPAGASPPLRAQAPRAKNLEDRLESRNPVLSGGQASRVTDAILTPGPLGLCRADDDTATRLMQSATAGLACLPSSRGGSAHSNTVICQPDPPDGQGWTQRYRTHPERDNLLLPAFQGPCVATAAIWPPIYLIRYPRRRAGPAMPRLVLPVAQRAAPPPGPRTLHRPGSDRDG
jgi:hypothetical protein